MKKENQEDPLEKRRLQLSENPYFTEQQRDDLSQSVAGNCINILDSCHPQVGAVLWVEVPSHDSLLFGGPSSKRRKGLRMMCPSEQPRSNSVAFEGGDRLGIRSNKLFKLSDYPPWIRRSCPVSYAPEDRELDDPTWISYADKCGFPEVRKDDPRIVDWFTDRDQIIETVDKHWGDSAKRYVECSSFGLGLVAGIFPWLNCAHLVEFLRAHNLSIARPAMSVSSLPPEVAAIVRAKPTSMDARTLVQSITGPILSGKNNPVSVAGWERILRTIPDPRGAAAPRVFGSLRQDFCEMKVESEFTIDYTVKRSVRVVLEGNVPMPRLLDESPGDVATWAAALHMKGLLGPKVNFKETEISTRELVSDPRVTHFDSKVNKRSIKRVAKKKVATRKKKTKNTENNANTTTNRRAQEAATHALQA